MGRLLRCMLALAVAVWAQDPAQPESPQPGEDGVVPLPRIEEFPTRWEGPGYLLGFRVLTAAETGHRFAAELILGPYLAVDVGVFPLATPVLLHHESFRLRIRGVRAAVPPSDPATIAGVLDRRSAEPRQTLNLYPWIPAGNSRQNETGGLGDRDGGISPGVGAAWTETRRAPPQDVAAVAAELETKQLPQRLGTHPMRGFLFFPLLAANRKLLRLELEYCPQPRAGCETIDLGTVRWRTFP